MAKTYKYQVVVGRHAEMVSITNEGKVGETVNTVTYHEGDYFESSDPKLVERFGADKFMRLPDNFDVVAANRNKGQVIQSQEIPSMSSDTLSSMTEKELRDYAAEEEIDLSGAKSKADILKILQSKLQTV